jgi:chromosome condensin MukBEF ATPase and DNA-binding subunit MukB
MTEGINVLREEQERAERGEDEARRLKAAIDEKENAKLKIEALEGQNRLLESKLAEIDSQVSGEFNDRNSVTFTNTNARTHRNET